MRVVRKAISAAFVLVAPAVTSGCTKPNLAASFVCQPSSLGAVPIPSSAYTNFSIPDLRTAAAGGDRAAARVVGERYEQGIGVEANLKQAVEWYETAAFVSPQTLPVYMPGNGKVPPTFLQVTSGPALSADPVALSRLGDLYLSGRGMPMDLARGRLLLACVAAYRSSSVAMRMGNDREAADKS